MAPNPNPNPKSTMAFHFMKSLANIRQTTTTTNSSSFGGGSRRINRAAYASMAVAAGPTRAWSKALLRRVQRGQRLMRRHNNRIVLVQRRRARVSRSPTSRVESLQRLVPGGERMDLCCLLEETASYVECLRDQVSLMQSLVMDSA